MMIAGVQMWQWGMKNLLKIEVIGPSFSTYIQVKSTYYYGLRLYINVFYRHQNSADNNVNTIIMIRIIISHSKWYLNTWQNTTFMIALYYSVAKIDIPMDKGTYPHLTITHSHHHQMEPVSRDTLIWNKGSTALDLSSGSVIAWPLYGKFSESC